MSSIEDILNGEDSGDDVECGGLIDVEHLLLSRDEYDDDHMTTVAVTTDLPNCTVPQQRFEEPSTLDRNDDSLLDETSVSGILTDKLIQTTDVDGCISSDSATDQAAVEAAPIDKLGGLNGANVREQQFLASGRRKYLSALQSKRNSVKLLNHSSVRCEELAKVSDQLRRNAAFKPHGPGAATSIAVTEGFLAVGTSKGLVILFDHSEEIRQVLGSNLPAGTRPSVPITEIGAPKGACDGSSQGTYSLLLCGYASGEIALWDVVKGTIVKLVNDLHTCSISALCVLETASEGLSSLNSAGAVEGEQLLSLPAGWRSGSQNRGQSANPSDFTRFFSGAASSGFSGVSLVVLSCDTSGVMYSTRFTKTLWSPTFSAESECLLDASTGGLSAVATLGPLLRALGRETEDETLLSCRYLVAHRTTRILAINVGPTQTWVVQTHPKIKIVYKWEAPTGADGPSRDLAWTWVQDPSAQAGEPYRDWQPLLARCWGEEIQTLVLRTTVSSPPATGPVDIAPSAYATSSAFGTTFGNLLMTGSSRPGSTGRGAVPCTYTSKFVAGHRRNLPGLKVLALQWVSCRELVLLTVSDVVIVNTQLQTIGQLPLAPSMSMDFNVYYNHGVDSSTTEGPAEGTCLVGRLPLRCDVWEQRMYAMLHESAMLVHTQSCFELADSLIQRAQWLEALALIIENTRRTVELSLPADAEVDSYIVRYADLAVKHSASTAGGVAGRDSDTQARNHFHLVAGVCIEYCVACARQDVLFSQVYHIFRSARRHDAFLEALEPYILSCEVTILPPAVIAEFCEFAVRNQRLPSIERCVAYFDVAHLDLNFMTRFLYENRMYSGFLYVFANGLSDFRGAFQVVFSFMFQSDELERSSWAPAVGGGGGAGPQVQEVGYKLLLFLSYSFEGKVFPRGDPLKTQWPDRVVLELLDLVTSTELRPMPSFFPTQSSASITKGSSVLGAYPYLSELAALDHRALLAVLRRGLEFVLSPTSTALGSGGLLNLAGPTEVMDRIRLFCDSGRSSSITPRDFYEEFMSVAVKCPHRLPDAFSFALVEHVAARDLQEREAVETRLSELMEHQVRASGFGECSHLRRKLQQHGFWIASLACVRAAGHADREEVFKEQMFSSAIQHYVSLATSIQHPPSVTSAPQLFQYVEIIFAVLECTFSAAERKGHEDELCAVVVASLLPMCRLDLGRTKQLMKAHLRNHVQAVISSTAPEPRLRYQLLSALLWSQEELLSTRINALQSSFSSQDILVYVGDLATYDPARVVSFLRTFEPYYPLDECMHLCRQRGLSEAVAYLMERAGQALDALVMLLKDFSVKLKQVRRDVDAQLRVELAAQAAAARTNVRVAPHDAELHIVSTILSKQDAERSRAARKLPGYDVLLSIMTSAADLCARNSRVDGVGMWLMVFDHLLMERRKHVLRTQRCFARPELMCFCWYLQRLCAQQRCRPLERWRWC